MSVIVKHIPHTVDLNEPVKKVYIDTLLATEDNLAHCFDITLKQGVPSGATVTAYFIRYSDNATIILTGTVNDNVVSVTLNKSCYNKAGQYAVIIKVVADGVTNTVFYGEGTIFASSTDTIVDEDNVIPSLEDLLAQIDTMEAATERANAASARAESLAINASGYAASAGMLDGTKAQVRLRNEEGYPGLDFYGRVSGETDLTMRGTIRQNLKEVNSRGFAKLEYLNAANSRIGRIYTTEDPPTAAEVGIPIITPQMHGAKGDNTTDDTAAIQAAINAVQNKGGGMVFFPAGKYVITDTIKVTADGVRLVGECPQSTYIIQRNPGKDGVHFNGTPDVENGALSGVSMSHLTVMCDSTQSTGIGVKLYVCVNSSIENVIVTEFKIGVDLDQTGNSFVKMVGVATSVANAIGFRHGNHSVSTQYIDIFAGFLPDAAESSSSAFWTGIGFSATSGNIADFVINYLDVGNGSTGVYINGTDSPADYPPADIRLYDIICDNCHSRGIDIQNITNRGNVVIDGGWLNLYQSASTYCVNLNSVYHVAIHNVTFQQLLNAAPTQFGIVASSAVCVSVQGCRFINIKNGFSVQNPYRWIISNNIFYVYGADTVEGYAIYLNIAVRTNVTGNVIKGPYLGGVMIDGDGSSKNIVTMNNIEGSATPVSVAGTGSYTENNIS